MAMEIKDDPAGLNAAGELLLGLLVSAFSIFVIVESIRMPLRGHLGILMSPGFVPLLTGLGLLILSLIIDVGAIRKGAIGRIGDLLSDIAGDEENRRFLVILGLMAGYTIGLIGRMPFWAATAIFHFLIFSYLKIGGWPKIIFFTALATVLVALLLPGLFEMPLP